MQGRSTAAQEWLVCYSKLDVGQASREPPPPLSLSRERERGGTGIQAINSVMCNVRVRRNFFITQMKYLYMYICMIPPYVREYRDLRTSGF